MMTRAGLRGAGALTAALAVLAASTAHADTDTNADIDAIYARIAQGIRTNDPDLSHQVYADDAVYLGSFPGPIDRGAAVHEGMRASAARLKSDGASMTITFRLVDRKRVGSGTAVDTGYYKTDMTRPTGEPRTMTRYNKFLVVAARQADGRWKITHDASTPATKAAFDAAVERPRSVP